MKLSRLLPLLIAVVPPVAARADTPKACQGKNFATCFQLLLQQRCVAYAKGNLFSKREYFCEMSSVAMMEIMRPYQPKDDPDHVVAFPHRIGELITDAKVQSYLADLPGAVDKAIEAGEFFNFWEYTLARAGSDDRALLWIAVLFQDNHPDENIVLAEARVDFGNRKTERKLTPKEFKIWEEALAAISFDRLADASPESEAMFFGVYPNGVDGTFFSAGMYHFYFSAHIARELQKKRRSKTPQGIDMNGFAPFLLNTLYEMHADIDPDLGPLEDAKPFDVAEKWHSLRDFYAGYVGSLYGLGGVKLAAKAESYDSLSKRFAKNPRGTIRALYRNFRPAVAAPTKK